MKSRYLLLALSTVMVVAASPAAVFAQGNPGPEAVTEADPAWRKHVVQEGFGCNAAAAADFDGDGTMDVVASSGGKVRVFYRGGEAVVESAVYVYDKPGRACIHCEVMDVDADGDADYVGANSKGPVFWLENPGERVEGLWAYRIVDAEIDGIHCLLKGDVDGDGRDDLLVNHFEPAGPLGNSLLWERIPDDPRAAKSWQRGVFAAGDAGGGSHYFGFGDIDGDGAGDVTCGAKGEPFSGGNWFAFWRNPGPSDVEQPWQKTVVAEGQPGATNILPADVNGDGAPDLVASRGHGRGVLWFEAPDWKPHSIHEELEGPHCLTVADYDKDGDLDVATCAKDSRWVMLYRNDGSGTFERLRLDADQAAYDIRSVDLDGDDDLDLLIAGQRSQNVVWYENPLR